MVTPDPGVIEVNLQPTSSWAELSELTSRLYAIAREHRLGTETFALDGRHSGTGGGNHITLGAAEPSRSPLLRRPDLLVSLLTFWQHHPAMSYLFSGRFVGPTSQAPRVDEGRAETLYELEIAFAEIERLVDEPGGAEHRPWVVDRALRHLLTDITGNTHRSEFCIDKLYSPDSLRGRLGLLELRGFEMPPHPEMALVQALLVRALVARCAAEPYRAPLVRWGTRLHEQYLLPHYVAADIADVVADLRAHGTEFDLEWLAPFLEFRFPRIGVAAAGRVEIELRTAIEPWHVLGEEAASGGTARYVDSSTERVQVTVRGFDPSGPPADLQRGAGAVDRHRHAGGARRRGPLQGVAALVRAAPDARGRLAADLRRGGPGQSALAGRRDLPRGAPGRAGLRPPAGQRQGGRGPALQPVRGDGPHYGGDRRRRAGRRPGLARCGRRRLPGHPRPAPAAAATVGPRVTRRDGPVR